MIIYNNNDKQTKIKINIACVKTYICMFGECVSTSRQQKHMVNFYENLFSIFQLDSQITLCLRKINTLVRSNTAHFSDNTVHEKNEHWLKATQFNPQIILCVRKN